jgi:hypothetical protein
MSGPIVRKYGFPNFDQIFGKRELEHGVEGKKPVDPLHRGEEVDQGKVESTSPTEKSDAEPPKK